jgi:hypothetical protein
MQQNSQGTFMRTALFASLISLILTARAAAVTLETAARVSIVSHADAALDRLDPDGATAWNLTGAPGDRLQLSVELRSPDGERLAFLPTTTLSLDMTGQALAALGAPDCPVAPVVPHDALPVVTLVICRE